MKDVVIVGGGPSGCFLAGELAQEGFEVVVLEEHAEIGQPMCCAGILGAHGLKEVGLNPEDWSINELRGATFHTPSGESFSLTRNKTEAHVIDRAKFDRDLAERASRAGAEILLNARCEGISRRGGRVSLEVENRGGDLSLECRMVVGADGPNSLVARSCGLMEDFSPIAGAQAEVVDEPGGKTADLYFGGDWSRSFYAWVVPAGEVYRVGLGDRKAKVRKKLLQFMEQNLRLGPDARGRTVRFTTGLIPRPGTRRIYGERVLLIGDAAAHVKPLTGGGLYVGLSCARIAGRVAARALENEPSEGNLREYESKVDEKFGRDFELGTRAMEIFRRMSDEEISEFLKSLEDPKIRNLILQNADFDHHSRLFEAFMREGPEVLRSLGAKKAAKYLRWFVSS